MADPTVEDTSLDLNYKAGMSLGRWEEAVSNAEKAGLDEKTITVHKALIRLAKGMLSTLKQK